MGLWANLDNADDTALIYVAHVLPCLASCGLNLAVLQVKLAWSASMHAWGIFDSALLSLNQGSGTVVHLKVNPESDIPPWETLPYECVDEMIMHLLPKCAAAGIVFRCDSGRCGLHDPGRWHLQTRGTAQDLFKALRTWISPIKYWNITLRSTFESLEEFLYETHSLWEKLFSIFILSVDARLRDVLMDICVEGLGKLTLFSSNGTSHLKQLPSLCSNLTFVQTQHPLRLDCGFSSTTQTIEL